MGGGELGRSGPDFELGFVGLGVGKVQSVNTLDGNAATENALVGDQFVEL